MGLLIAISGLLATAVWLGSGWYAAGSLGSPNILVYSGQVTVTNPALFGSSEVSLFSPDAWHLMEPEGRAARFNWRVDLSEWGGGGGPLIVHDVLVYGWVEIPPNLVGKGPVPTIRAFVLWPIPLALFIPAALLLRSGIIARRRAVTNGCAKCGYSLTGILADAPCPECGAMRMPSKAII